MTAGAPERAQQGRGRAHSLAKRSASEIEASCVEVGLHRLLQGNSRRRRRSKQLARSLAAVAERATSRRQHSIKSAGLPRFSTTTMTDCDDAADKDGLRYCAHGGSLAGHLGTLGSGSRTGTGTAQLHRHCVTINACPASLRHETPVSSLMSTGHSTDTRTHNSRNIAEAAHNAGHRTFFWSLSGVAQPYFCRHPCPRTYTRLRSPVPPRNNRIHCIKCAIFQHTNGTSARR